MIEIDFKWKIGSLFISENLEFNQLEFHLDKKPSQYNNWISLFIWAGVPNAFISNNLSKICSNPQKSSSRSSKKPKNCTFHQTFPSKITISDWHQLKCHYLDRWASWNMTQTLLFRLRKDYFDKNCQIKLKTGHKMWSFDVEGFDKLSTKYGLVRTVPDTDVIRVWLIFNSTHG